MKMRKPPLFRSSFYASYFFGKIALLVAGFAIGLPTNLWGQGAAPPLILPGGEESLWKDEASAYYSLYREATDPVAVDRMIMPWEASKAVALALPLGEFNENPQLRRIFRDTLAALLPRIDVIAFYHRRDRSLLGDFYGRLEADSEISSHLSRLSLESSDAYSIWMRDFGPQFALGEKGSLVLLDPSIADPGASRELLYDVKTVEDPLQQHFRMIEELRDLRGLEGSDRLPVLMAALLESRWNVTTRLSRPPLFLQGGDFLPVDDLSALVSASTLRVNGGVGQTFRAAVKEYYGVENVVFLENLPGKTIEHLDFIAQPIRANVILLAEPPLKFGGERSYHRLLERDLNAALARNESAIRKAFPESSLIKVPMPPPALDSDEHVRRELFLRALQMFIAKERLAIRFDPEDALANWNGFALDSRIEAKLKEVSGGADWRSAAGKEQIIETFLGSSFNALLSKHVEAQVNYRSYINSLYVKASDGREVVLVPRFAPLNSDEEALFPVIEKEVANAYSEACPEADLIWIDCTVLTDFMGMIHCYTLTVPDMSKFSESN